MYSSFKISEYEQQIYNTSMTLTDYAKKCVSYIIQLINYNNRNTPFNLIPTSVIIFVGSENLSIELANIFATHKNNLNLRHILLDNPATSYEQPSSKTIEDLIINNDTIKELTYEKLIDSDTYEKDLIIIGATYAGVEYSEYNTHSHNLLVKCVDPTYEDKFLYNLTDFQRAHNSFCNESMYSVLNLS